MRREAIPPLRGGALQALPNIQTTLRDHPNPASRPMTLGHFTSWRADDRGYYTGGMKFLGQILPHMQWLRMIHIAHDTCDRHDRHETDTGVGHIFGANSATHAVVTYDTYCT